MIRYYNDSVGQSEQPYIEGSSVEYAVQYRPFEWQANTVYTAANDIVIPLSGGNGYYYTVIRSGVSGQLEPVWTHATTKSGDVTFSARQYDFLLGYDDVITSSVWSSDQAVVMSDDTLINGVKAQVRISSVPQGIDEFNLINTINVTRSTGGSDIIVKRLNVKVKRI